MENKKLSTNFSLSEFNFVEPDPRLLKLLQALRDETKRSITITDSTREVTDHIAIYKKQYGAKWIENIPLGSKHLPTFKTPYLRAVDFGCSGLSGKQIRDLIIKIRNKIDPSLKIGIGTGKNFVHLDIDRTSDAEWSYNY